MFVLYIFSFEPIFTSFYLNLTSFQLCKIWYDKSKFSRVLSSSRINRGLNSFPGWFTSPQNQIQNYLDKVNEPFITATGANIDLIHSLKNYVYYAWIVSPSLSERDGIRLMYVRIHFSTISYIMFHMKTAQKLDAKQFETTRSITKLKTIIVSEAVDIKAKIHTKNKFYSAVWRHISKDGNKSFSWPDDPPPKKKNP